MSLPRVCYLGGYDPIYPRNLLLRRGLKAHGVEVIQCQVEPSLSTQQRIVALRPQFESIANQCDVIILAEFNQTLARFARQLANRFQKHLVIDAFTSIYDSAVLDRAIVKPLSIRGLFYWWVDWMALRIADTILVDTEQHRDYFIRTFNVSQEKFAVIPVGATHEWFDTAVQSEPQSSIMVLFYGTYIPLHGIETILLAIHHLQHRADILFELIGKGQTYHQMRTIARQLSLDNLTFHNPVPFDDLPTIVAQADICLGIFGTTEKALRVVPNKVYQTLAMGKPLITADSPAINSHFTVGEHIHTVPAGDDQALADAILKLANDPSYCTALATAGRHRMEQSFTEEQIGRMLLEAIT